MAIEEETKQISRYNDAFYSINRLHDSWLRCKTYIRRGNFRDLKYELDIVWLELYTDVLRQHDKQDIIKKNKDIMNQISNATTKSYLFYLLKKRYEFLREIQDTAGKGNVYVDENSEGFE